MSEVESAATQLKTQYAAQVAADLERNTKEQERIGAELVALEEQLGALRHDRTLLAELQRALGGDNSAQAVPGATGKSTAPAPAVPRQVSASTATRKKAAAKPAGAKPAAKPTTTKPASKSAAKSTAESATSKPAPSQPAPAQPVAKSAAAEPAAGKPAAGKPTLVELIRDHLGRQSEPRSSAEVATALAEAHPDREIKPKVVRTTVEGLVAKGQVQRTKQGSSVFYTTSSGTTPAPTATAEAEVENKAGAGAGAEQASATA